MENITTKQKEVSGEDIIKILFLIMLVLSILLVAAFFMPLATAKEDYRSNLMNNPDKLSVPELKMTNKDLVDMSIYDFAKVHWYMYRSMSKDSGIVIMTITAIIGMGSIFILIFSIFKKILAVLIFDILTFGAYYLLIWDFKDRGVMPNLRYNWGISYYIFFIITGLIFVVGIYLFTKNKKLKK